MCNPSSIQKYGYQPANVRWTITRGDTAQLSIDFLENDETTGFDTDGWTYQATAYDPQGDVLDVLQTASEGYSVTITAPASITANWGTKYQAVVADIPFDLQVTIPNLSGEPTIWTPVLGNITVLGDITPGGCL